MLNANEVKPMPDDGIQLLDDLRDTFTRYVAFPDHHSEVAVTLWDAATHALPAFECAPRLVITSPQKRCGKTRLLDIIGGTCHNQLATVDATVAAIFRSLGGDHPPTLIIDEADAIFGTKKAAENNEDLRKLLNAGHQRGKPAIRCFGPTQIPTKFDVFAMAVLAGIGGIPDTITDRAVNINMRRRAPGEKVSQFRSRRDGPNLHKLRDRLAAWAATHKKALTEAIPEMPVEDRAADTWEPLIAVADAAGGHWPDTARAACRALVAAAETADEDQSLAVKLLTDIKQTFTDTGAPFLPSTELVTALRGIEESPWNDFDLTSRKLAHRLSGFGVKPQRNTAGNARGYRLHDLRDTFARYTRQDPSEPSETGAKQREPSDGSNPSDGSMCQTENIRQNETPCQIPFLTGLTDADATPTGNGHGHAYDTPRRPGCVCTGQPEPCHWCELASKAGDAT